MPRRNRNGGRRSERALKPLRAPLGWSGARGGTDLPPGSGEPPEARTDGAEPPAGATRDEPRHPADSTTPADSAAHHLQQLHPSPPAVQAARVTTLAEC